MPVSLEFVNLCASDTGYDPNTLEKVIRLGELAEAINNHAFLTESLLLKGGTPLNLAFGLPSRLSVDLDYNYVGEVNRQRMIDKRPEVENAIVSIAERMSYSVQQSAYAFAGKKFFLGYRSVLGNLDRVEVDISYLYRVQIGLSNVRPLWQPGGLDDVNVRVVSDMELVIGKILAFLDRVAPRDAWDITQLSGLLLEVLQSSNGRGWFIAMSAILDHPLDTYTNDRVRKLLTPKMIREQLIPMLAGEHSLDSNTLADDAWQIVSPLLDITPEEHKYIDALQKGELCAELLFPDDEDASKKVASHPAICWKIKNVLEQLGSTKK
jgi:hypothetical protein